jgi:hypothetical protein
MRSVLDAKLPATLWWSIQLAPSRPSPRFRTGLPHKSAGLLLQPCMLTFPLPRPRSLPNQWTCPNLPVKTTGAARIGRHT